MTRTYWTIALLWTIACVACLLIGLGTFSSSGVEVSLPSSERRMISHLGTQILGFPAAFMLAGSIADLAREHGIILYSVTSASAAPFLRDWAISYVIGFVQWFVVVPWLVRMIRRVRGQRFAGRT